MYEKTITSQTVFDGVIMRVEVQEVELENGHRARRELVRHRGAVAVLARHTDGRFVLVRQFRKAVERYMLEIIAGLRETGEPAEACARRELREEAGYEAQRLVPLGQLLPSPGYICEQIELFYAEVTGAPGPQDPDEGEFVQVVYLTEAELLEQVRRRELPDSKTLAAWLLYEKLIAPRPAAPA